MMEHKNLAAALVAAQFDLSAPAKNRTVKVKSEKGSYSFDYATLDGIVEHTLRPVLPKHGLWFAQLYADGQMVTRIIHESGETMDCGVPMPNLSPKPQEAGSLISYFKRYSLCQAFGLVAEEDDDGNIAQGNGFDAAPRQGGAGKPTQAQKPAPQPTATAEPEQGWPDWVDGFKNVIGGYNDSGEIDELQKRNKAKLEALRLANPSLYAEIGQAIKTRRTEIANPQKEAA